MSVWNEAGEEVGVISDGMIFEEDVDEFFFMDGTSVIGGAVQQIAIVFPEENARAPVTLYWDGTGLDGTLLANGAYIVKVESVDSLGITTVVTGGASILRVGSLVTVRIFNEAGERVWESILDGISLTQDQVSLEGSMVDPSLPAGSPGSSVTVVLGTTLNLPWSGRDLQGRPLANGEYIVEIRIENAGQETLITASGRPRATFTRNC